MDTIVTFETAKLAKEVGFDTFTGKAYIKKSNQELFFTPCYTGMTDGIAYHVPTQTTLWKWMREKGIEVYPPLPYGDKWACSLIRLEDTQFFDTWEDALENELYNKLKLWK